MAMEYTRGYCHECDWNVRAERAGLPHALMTALCVVTCGLFAPAYLLMVVCGGMTPYRCRWCGGKVAANSEMDLDPPPRRGKLKRAYDAANTAYDAYEWASWLWRWR
jgi:hypothetical protein